jgi:hypothetical protein
VVPSTSAIFRASLVEGVRLPLKTFDSIDIEAPVFLCSSPSVASGQTARRAGGGALGPPSLGAALWCSCFLRCFVTRPLSHTRGQPVKYPP